MKKTPKLMVVDDEIDICNFVKSFFEMRGFQVATALNGDEALSKITGENPDILLLDVMMRGGNEGIEYLPRIKKALPSAKVIMVTAVEDDKTMETAKSLGADDYITKPLVLEYLETTVMGKIKSLNVGE